LKNTIRKIDGVIDADVQISFPSAAGGGGAGGPPVPGAPQQKITAAVYVKHQGILEDPNSHIEVKIKRLMAGSVSGLSYDDVAVISDRSRFADITLTPEGEPIGPRALQTHASIWGLHFLSLHHPPFARPCLIWLAGLPILPLSADPFLQKSRDDAARNST
jgi:type III secretion protein J